MRSYSVLLCMFLMLHSLSISAQDSIPLLRGKVEISVKKGTIVCNLTLTDMPRVADYLLRINAGMNIRNFRNVVGKNLLYYERAMNDTLSTGETVGYYFPANNGKDKFQPKEIQFRYEGMFPVTTDTINNYQVQDWKGNISFNGYAVRTDGLQSGWYPVLFDRKLDKTYEKVRYDIEITCSDCSVLYVNGSKPVKGTFGRFKSEIPRELTLFCGRYNFSQINGSYFLNPDINASQLKEFGKMIDSYKKFYEHNINIPVKDTITFIQTVPSSKDNAWLFVSYPSIVNIGYGKYGLISLFDKETADWFKPYIAHELGHYYFGTYKKFNASLGDMMSEGFAEFLSMKVAKTLIGDTIYKGKLSEKLKALKTFDATPMASVSKRDDYKDRELYVYYYAPVIFLAIEKEIGEQRMWNSLSTILETPATYTNYAFLVETLEKVVDDPALAARIKAKYFESKQAIETAAAELAK